MRLMVIKDMSIYKTEWLIGSQLLVLHPESFLEEIFHVKFGRHFIFILVEVVGARSWGLTKSLKGWNLSRNWLFIWLGFFHRNLSFLTLKICLTTLVDLEYLLISWDSLIRDFWFLFQKGDLILKCSNFSLLLKKSQFLRIH
jgi:hypothetical protein